MIAFAQSCTLRQPGDFTVTVPAGATGTVSFFDGTTLLGTAPVTGNTASLTVSTLAAGTHTITAVYSGDANFTLQLRDFSLVVSSQRRTSRWLRARDAS